MITGTVARSGGFTGTVNIAVLDPPAGVTGTVTTPPTSDNPSATVTLTVGATATPGTDVITVQASGNGVQTVTQTFTLTVTAAPSFTVAAEGGGISVAQGMSGSAAIVATRTNGFPGVISYVATGAPAGLTVAIAPTSIADSVILTVTASATLAANSYPITVTATSGTVTRTATVTVTVTPVALIRLDYSSCGVADKPIWVAYQNGTGPFVHATGSGDVYTIPAVTAGKGAIAVVTDPTAYFRTSVQYYTQAEFNALTGGCAAAASTGKTISGSVAGVSGTQFGYVSLGGVTGSTNASHPTFQLTGVANGIQDLVAYRAAGFTLSAGDRIVIHRDQNIPDAGSTGVIDFSAPEAVAPALGNITVTGGATTSAFASLDYLTGANCSSAALNFNTNTEASPITIYGVPASVQRATDFHELILSQATGQSDARTVSLSFHTVADRTVAIGAGVGPLTVTELSGAYRRYQAVFTLAPDYQTASIDYVTAGSTVTAEFVVNQSAGYLAGSAQVTLAAPDLSAVDGYQLAWAPTTGSPAEYYVTVSSAPPATFCTEGAVLRTASSGVGGS